MRHHSVLFRALPFLMVLAIFSCKKDDTSTDDTQYMTGTLTYTLTQYLTAGQQVQLSASGITEPTSGLTYRWYTTGFSVDSLDGQNVTLTAPNGFGDYSVTLKVTHNDYAAKTLQKSTTVINPGVEGSYSGTVNGPLTFTDTRDGKVYNYKQYDKLYWFTSNLQWTGAGNPYNKEFALSPVYGVLYTWNEATGGVTGNGLGNGPKGVCPEGWRVPTREDWANLASYLNGSPLNFDASWSGLGEKLAANAKLNGANIWKYSPNNLKTNSSGWNALPGGSSTNYFKSFANINQFGFWWSSAEKDSGNGIYRFIHFDMADFPYNFADKSYFGASVRCVKQVL
ncbi:MAG: FISUMP domain-containing protein [Bacteroidales bacterium]